MKKCVIFCAGEFDSLALPIDPEDLILAADGGLRHTQTLGLTPDAVLGDFDSLGFIPENAQVFPVEKDDTDALLAVREGLRRGCRAFYLYGAMDGTRLDHTIANFQILEFLALRNARGYLIGKEQLATVVRNGSLEFPQDATGILSLFCLGADATGVTLQGLKYPLEQGVLTAGRPLGVSNHFIGEKSVISVENGSLLAIWDRKNGFPICKE